MSGASPPSSPARSAPRSTVRVRYHDAGSPIAFADPADPSRTQIVMPLRV